MPTNRVSHANPALRTRNRPSPTYVAILVWNPLPKHLIEQTGGHIGTCNYLKEVSCSIRLWCEFELQKSLRKLLTKYQSSGVSLGAQTDGFSATFAGQWTGDITICHRHLHSLYTHITALIFHQLFEGLGLGARISLLIWPSGITSSVKKHLLCLAYTLTTPVGIAIVGNLFSFRWRADVFHVHRELEFINRSMRMERLNFWQSAFSILYPLGFCSTVSRLLSEFYWICH